MGPWLLPAIGAGASFLGGFFDHQNQKNPADAANPYLNQIPGMLQGAYNPYIQAGQQALPQLQQGYGAMMNPNFINNMGKNFQQSPGYQFQLNQALAGGNRAAAAGGYAGTPAEQQNLAGISSGLANQDYYNWLNHSMNAYNTGIQGEQGLYNTGFNASNELANNMGSALESQANLAYAGQQNQNQMNGGWLGAGLGFLGNFIGGMGNNQNGMNQGQRGMNQGQGVSNDWGPMAW